MLLETTPTSRLITTEVKMKSTIRLLKALPITTKRTKKSSKTLLEKTIPKGFIFSPEVVYNYSEKELTDLIKIVEEELGLTAEQMNSSFHKSWQKIKEASIEQLVLEQILHYITTYGFEALGIYDEHSVYIPNEKLEIPDVKLDNINLVVIKGYTKKELKEKLLKLLGSGIALSEDTMDDIIDIVTFVGFDENDVKKVKNKEVKIALYDYKGLVPENPVEFLRYVVFKATGKTLLIKDAATIEAIKENEDLKVGNLFMKYKKQHGLERLAEIFYRFKPLFLAFKNSSQSSNVINRIRKLAKKHHKPMPEDYLNEVTAKLKKGKRIDKATLEKELSKVNTFRKIRLAYALHYRIHGGEI